MSHVRGGGAHLAASHAFVGGDCRVGCGLPVGVNEVAGPTHLQTTLLSVVSAPDVVAQVGGVAPVVPSTFVRCTIWMFAPSKINCPTL